MMTFSGSKKPKIAVVGAGIFGITTAVAIARKGYRTDLYEKNKDILMGASGINQYRLHRGYHYPRSPETMRECMESEPLFVKEYSGAVISGDEHYYCIAKKGSLISADDYLKVCRMVGLKYRKTNLGLLNKKAIDLCLEVDEKRIDVHALYQICRDRIKKYKINLLLNTEATERKLKKYDFVIIATYSHINHIAKHFSKSIKPYQYELCEKPVVRLSKEFKNKCIVLMDGPFMCLDPIGRTDRFAVGNVVHAIHTSNTDHHPIIPKEFASLINAGIIKKPLLTNFSKFIDHGAEFIPALARAEHVGSMFTFRTVLPNLERTDARPTIVEDIHDKAITVFSGKIGTCVSAANQVLHILKLRGF